MTDTASDSKIVTAAPAVELLATVAALGAVVGLGSVRGAARSCTSLSRGVSGGHHDGGADLRGHAKDRRGAGLRGRMTAYCTGKAAVSGLGRAVLDHALNDDEFSPGAWPQ